MRRVVMEKKRTTILLACVLVFVIILTGCTSENGDEKTPEGNLVFTESQDTPGLYTGNFVNLSRAVKLGDIQVTITDASKGQSNSINDLSADEDAFILDGLTFQFTDVNDNDKLDVGDTFQMTNVAKDDIVKFIYNPDTKLIAEYLFGQITGGAPVGALDFTESTQTTGRYTGSFVSLSKSAPISDVSWTITDDSTGHTQSQDPLNPETTLHAGAGMNATYYDNNGNEKIDGGDTIRVYNGASGDIIKFVYRPTGETIAQYTFI
jgi:hypothetical protein